MSLLSAIKSKGLTILCIILITLLSTTYISLNNSNAKLKVSEDKLLQHVKLNKSLSDQNLSLLEEIKNKPKEFITVTKEVSKEVCNGLVKETLINSLPKKGSVSNEPYETNTADIDDNLPTNLIKLLNQSP